MICLCGIDYSHPALGGGFGPGFKVVGGYDLFNNDADPMDDHYHGTHVAGIVAAEGNGLRGVAPRASLMAFKVLDASGFASESIIISGIERAMDPNDDGDFRDRVDIINMSLGGPGDPDNALSQATDNAVKLGTVVCVAAGNHGGPGNHYFDTIGSPGTARLAITVGASDKSDQLAVFSSKGPNKKIFSVKPEVVAPGVDLNSTFSNHAYDRHSGTSMAAPHVASVCAVEVSPSFLDAGTDQVRFDDDRDRHQRGNYGARRWAYRCAARRRSVGLCFSRAFELRCRRCLPNRLERPRYHHHSESISNGQRLQRHDHRPSARNQSDGDALEFQFGSR
jgi:hypothetical protein